MASQDQTQRDPLIKSSYTRSLLAGGIAGTTVDTSLYPLDTLKTRLQSSRGFLASGGFRGVYNGIGSAVVGSAPGAALFFVTYESVKKSLDHNNNNSDNGNNHGSSSSSNGGKAAASHMLAASLGEVAACAVRVPTEVVKQRAQAKQSPSSLAALRAILAQRQTLGHAAVGRELYRGWGITVLREVPFTVIQFPLWEAMKASYNGRSGRRETPALPSALFGSLSGAVAAGLTTPLDVLKTRMMLSTGAEREGVWDLTARLWREEGARAFFKGLGPRTMWISIGGAVFLGSYQAASNALGGRG
ncbi:hypothetical protein MBLNU230_g2329t1 [Neophaeotheca triangularis]